MKKIGFIFMIMSLLVACNAPADKDEGKNASSDNEIVTLTVDELLASVDNYVDKQVKLKGMVTHVCKHGGQKLFVAGGSEGIALRINTGESIPEFSIDMEGTEAEFTGTVKLMTEEFKAEAEAEHVEHHGEEGAEAGVPAVEAGSSEKTYYLVADSFKSL